MTGDRGTQTHGAGGPVEMLQRPQRWPISPPQFMSLREQTRTLTDIGVHTGGGAVLPLTGRGEARWLQVGEVSAGFMKVMGAEPILGRTFVENLPGSDGILVISHVPGRCTGFRSC